MNEARRKALFTRWLREHKGIMKKVARSFTDDRDDQDDLYQDILIQVWQAVPTYRKQAKLSTWLYRIALNTALMNQRKERTKANRSIPLGDIEEPVVPESRQKEMLDQIYRAIRKLNHIDRSIMLLHLDGFSYQESADIIGMTESNIGVRLNRAKHQLTRHISLESSHGF